MCTMHAHEFNVHVYEGTGLQSVRELSIGSKKRRTVQSTCTYICTDSFSTHVHDASILYL